MAGFSVVLLGFIFTIIAILIGIFVVFLLPLITSFIVIPKESDKRMKKVFKMWGGVLGVQFLTSLIMIAMALLIDLAIPFETWTKTTTGFLGLVISSVVRITPMLLLMFFTLLWYKRISLEKARIRTYIVFGVQSILMSFGSGVPVLIIFALMQN